METNVRPIETELLGYLERDPRVEGEVDAGTELIDSGALDSLAILDLVVFVERRFGIELAADDVTPRNFGSIASLAALIERRR